MFTAAVPILALGLLLTLLMKNLKLRSRHHGGDQQAEGPAPASADSTPETT
ncbi:hypothetical protein [Streptomyces sp. NBC_01185]|uniref:hypothetical protein n=1 Tax=Streptomyces sp. NBC_01185 TaxID=2903764 RepID=UPI00386F79BF|nr:hypothetical protein OG770_36340 [Streptomyces sp. NBC_01185]